MARNKALAILLGPAGIGLIGIYMAIVDIAHSIASLGVNQSGVRQIAESASKDEQQSTGITAQVLRQTSVILGTLGAFTIFLCAELISNLTFGSTERTVAIRLLAGAVLFKQVTDGRGALLQGLRKIGLLARANIASAFLSSVAMISIAFAFGEAGIAPAILAAMILSTIIMTWYVSTLGIRLPRVPAAKFFGEASSLLRLGFAFMISGVMMMGAAYAVRTFTYSAGGDEFAGLYQAAWTLGGMYSGFILQAMGTDFYPRLVGSITDRDVRNRLVNEQTITSVILAGPGIVATLTLAPAALTLLYSSEFSGATDTLRWICVGMALRVISWPPGFLIVSINERKIFMATEIIWAMANIGLAALLIPLIGLEGAGLAFTGSYVLHSLLVYCIVGIRYEYAPNRATVLGCGVFFAFISATLLIGYTLDGIAEVAASAMTTLLAVSASLYGLARMLTPEQVPRPIARLLRRLPITK